MGRFVVEVVVGWDMVVGLLGFLDLGLSLLSSHFQIERERERDEQQPSKRSRRQNLQTTKKNLISLLISLILFLKVQFFFIFKHTHPDSLLSFYVTTCFLYWWVSELKRRDLERERERERGMKRERVNREKRQANRGLTVFRDKVVFRD